MISPIILPLSLADPKADRLLFLMGEIMATGRSFWAMVRGSPVCMAWVSRAWMVSGKSERAICVMVLVGLGDSDVHINIVTRSTIAYNMLCKA